MIGSQACSPINTGAGMISIVSRRSPDVVRAKLWRYSVIPGNTLASFLGRRCASTSQHRTCWHSDACCHAHIADTSRQLSWHAVYTCISPPLPLRVIDVTHFEINQKHLLDSCTNTHVCCQYIKRAGLVGTWQTFWEQRRKKRTHPPVSVRVVVLCNAFYPSVFFFCLFFLAKKNDECFGVSH